MEQDCLTRARPAIQIEHCFCRILRNQAKGINLQAQGQPIASLQSQKLPQPSWDFQLTLG
jgi:hypothetical protein